MKIISDVVKNEKQFSFIHLYYSDYCQEREEKKRKHLQMCLKTALGTINYTLFESYDSSFQIKLYHIRRHTKCTQTLCLALALAVMLLPGSPSAQMRYRHLTKVLLLAPRLMFKASGTKLDPGSSQRCTVAGEEAMGQAVYRETLSRRKEKMLPLRVMQATTEQVPGGAMG